jgi:DNA-binding transcriptional MocR family regulator
VIGWPSPSLLPAPLLLDGAQHVLTSSLLSVPALQYAPDEGPLPLRQSLSGFLSAFYGDYGDSAQIPIERITTTGGASQNLSVALGALTDPVYPRAAWIVEPTYFLACRIFNDSGLTIRGVGDGGEGAGADVAELRRQMQEVEKIAEREGNNQPVSYCVVVPAPRSSENDPLTLSLDAVELKLFRRNRSRCPTFNPAVNTVTASLTMAFSFAAILSFHHH